MWDKIVDLTKAAAAMLQSGKVPPNTPDEYKPDMAAINFMASKKFFVVFCSIVILVLFYAVSVFVLFLTAPLPGITIPFVTIFSETIKILAIIVASFLGVQTALDFKYNSSTNTELKGERVDIKETIEEKHLYIEEARSRPDYEDDPDL